MPRADQTASLLFHAPTGVVHDRLAAALSSAGAVISKSDYGLTMACDGIDWKATLQAAATELSAPERRDIRVTPLSDPTQTQPTQQTLFGVRRLDRFLARLAAEWLHGIIDCSGLVSVFQPLVQQPPGRLHGYECLIHGARPDGRSVAPRLLFNAARDLEIIPAFDEMCRLACLRGAAGLRFKTPIFINFIPDGIYHAPTCLRGTIDAIDSAGLDRRQVVFEAVQAEKVSDRKHLADTLRYVQSQGCKVSLDDVGEGYAPLLSMHDPRPDYVKIDARLIRRAQQSTPAAKLLADLTEAARQRGIMTIAKGVENEADLAAAFRGIRITQGFVHAKAAAAPVDAEQMKHIIRRSRAVYAQPGKPPATATSPWDISGLYQQLTSMARLAGPDEGTG